MKKDHFDYLIVGGGIAGTVLALQLIENGNSLKIYDKPNTASASNVAAGIINPVTGQRFVKSWMFDNLISVASDFYQHYDELWGTSYFRHTPIHRALFSRNEQLNYENRQGDPFYEHHFKEQAALAKPSFKTAEDWCTILGARLDLAGFIEKAHHYIQENGGVIFSESITYDKLDLEADLTKYDGVTFDKMVCCEGIGILDNPLFKYLPMVPAKGECLILEIPALETKEIYKHKIFFVPLDKEHHYWVGANYDWEFVDASPTEAGKNWLLKKVQDSLQVPFEIKQHIAAIRPTGKDRRPFLGRHSQHPDVYIFNALGTKGSSLAPYWADQLIAFMEEGRALTSEVSISRFSQP